MSSNAKVVTFYGVCYAPESADAAKFRSGDDGKSEGVGSPAWMAANLYREARDGVQVVHFGHYDTPGFALAVEGTVDHGRPWEPMGLGDPDDEVSWVKLKAFCEKWGLQWSEPEWWAVPYYG